MIKRIIQPFKEFGFLAGLLYLADQFLILTKSKCRLFCYEFMVQPVPDKSIAPKSFSRLVEIREIKPGDPELSLMPPPENVLADRFDQPTICLGAFQNQKIIAYQWFCFGPYQEDEVRCTLIPLPEKQAVFDFDIYVFPEHRLGIAFVGLWDGANSYLRNKGIRYTCSRVSRFNLESRTAHAHMKWRCAGRAIFIKLVRWQIMLATLSPFVHLSLGEGTFPRVKLRSDTVLQDMQGCDQ